MPIAHNSYDDAARVYTVQFKPGGAFYRYQGVPPEQAQAINAAEPSDLGKVIREVLVVGTPYEFIKVDPDQAVDSEGGTL